MRGVRSRLQKAMKNQIIRTLIFQYILGGIYLFGTGLWDVSAWFSGLVGCLAALIPKTYFGIRMIQTMENGGDATRWLGSAYRFEFGKWVLMVLILGMAFTTDYSWNPIALFAGFVLIQISGLVAPLVTKGN